MFEFSSQSVIFRLWEGENQRKRHDGTVLYTSIHPSFCPEAVGRDSQAFSCHCRQIRYKLEAFASLSLFIVHSLPLSAWTVNFSHVHPRLPFWKGHATFVILHSSKLHQRENNIQRSRSDLKSLKRYTVFGVTVCLKEFSGVTQIGFTQHNF